MILSSILILKKDKGILKFYTATFFKAIIKKNAAKQEANSRDAVKVEGGHALLN